jgi:hypothetical protein
MKARWVNRRVKYICEECGNEDVHPTGSVYWSKKTQNWIVEDVFWDDYHWCENCEDSMPIEEVTIPNVGLAKHILKENKDGKC